MIQLHEREVRVPLAEDVSIRGTLTVPDEASAVVLFAHGSGSSRFSPRNRFVARTLQNVGLATMLVDLLTTAEEEQELYTRHMRFDISRLADRLVQVAHWLGTDAETDRLAIGYFGASTGAAAALVAAARSPEHVGAIVSRGGRPDLAGASLLQVRAPTLFIVGSADSTVIDLNETAYEHLRTEKKLEIVPGATHLFEEPGALEHVAVLARHWFAEHLVPAARHWTGPDMWP